MINNQDLLEGLNHGKGCVRYSNPKKINFDIVVKLLDDTVKSDSPIC